MKIGFYQFAPKLKDKDYNLKKVEDNLTREKFDLVVLPELFNIGYAFSSREEILPFSEPVPGETTEKLQNLAKSLNTIIIGGFAEREGDKIFNSSCLTTPNDIKIYRKVHLFKTEKLIFDKSINTGFYPYNVTIPSTKIQAKIGMLICFDWLFPEAARSLALRGAQIIAQPANLVLPYCQSAMKIRALENHVFIITANRIGEERGLSFTGQSQIVNPKGEVILNALRDEECMKFIEINPLDADDKKITELNDIFEDRRKEFYYIG